ncbi:MAG TPA: hypothetical protein PKL73_05410 [Polyangiaceae bacterium]|nr:MAG: hypothetical protein BWY17_01403 [Deltaproteobacteria bacterium ADurb.Bin207]HNS96371.1 hypothetical protein [Polyangiaceae bacterium]HNZ22913.1 hypothetical protein [Polyangiaceae bacterium]HOD21256.1 hypothetical protein [Polyangiaceae bacterium]HOE48415.1 hypothetical protein [Polyangiaceae bacterium]
MGFVMLVGCGGGKPEPSTPASTSDYDEMATESESEPEETSASSHSSAPVSEMGERPPPIPEAWELHQRDCDALGAKYEQLLLAVELEKLEARKLNEKQRGAAEQNVRGTAKQGAENWMRACEGIVGTVQVKSRWDCAYRANTLDRFKGCMDGKYDREGDD